MIQIECILVPKTNEFIPYGVDYKPFVVGTLYFDCMMARNNILKNSSGIYQIQSRISDKIYIGSASNLRSRKYNHFKKLRDKNHENCLLQNHYNKYGKNDLIFGVIESITQKQNECILDFRKRLLEREQYYIDNLKPKLNIAKIAGSPLGITRSEKFKQKRRGENNVSKRLEVKQKQSEARKYYWKNTDRPCGEMNPFFGKKHSVKTKQKISNANKGKLIGNKNALNNHFKHTLEEIEKMKAFWTEEKRKEHSEKLKGHVAWNKGLKGTYHVKTNGREGNCHSEKTKRKISEGIKKYSMNPESKIKRSIAAKKGWINRKQNLNT